MNKALAKATEDLIAENVRLREDVKRAAIEREEIQELLENERLLTRQFRDLATVHADRAKAALADAERDANLIGHAAAARMSAPGILALARQILEGRSTTSAAVAAGLTIGYEDAKGEAPAAAPVQAESLDLEAASV